MTRLEWFDKKLPGEIRDKAIENMKKEAGDYCSEIQLERECPSFFDAVSGAFIWNKSNEGHAFWRQVAEKF